MKEEYKSLIEELNNLSTNFEKNKERMKEISKVLVSYYMWWSNVKDAEKKSAEDDPKNIA